MCIYENILAILLAILLAHKNTRKKYVYKIKGGVTYMNIYKCRLFALLAA